MPEKFKNKYRIASHRKPGWDYSSNGMYFITLVTQHRVCNLGEIIVANIPFVQLSDFGKIVDAQWHNSFDIRNELFLDQYIIMPNHLHAIVVINNNESTTVDENDMDDVLHDAETHGRASLPSQTRTFHRSPKSISSFLAGFKSAVNSKIDDYIDEYDLNIPKYNRNNHFFQPNYHDHIIRKEKSYQNISAYIINNPAKWKGDKFYTK